MSVKSFKVLLVGESRVGKTSIITKFIDDSFQEDQQSTIGGTFSTKSVINCKRIGKGNWGILYYNFFQK